MKQLLIVSGKGGTGKTTVAGAFIRLLQATAYADCDVDAPNLHLLLAPHTNPENADFYGLDKAEIDAALCIRCGVCARYCRFDAIEEARPFHVDPFACEGCGVCEAVCPARAVRMVPAVAGELLLYRNDAVFSTARLRMGSGNSGLLVSEVKKRLEQASPMAEIAVIDGSPGIGCPVIASLSGSNMVLVVTEPSVSGQSDLERILQTAQVFSMQCAVCVNRYDISMETDRKNRSVLP